MFRGCAWLTDVTTRSATLLLLHVHSSWIIYVRKLSSVFFYYFFGKNKKNAATKGKHNKIASNYFVITNKH